MNDALLEPGLGRLAQGLEIGCAVGGLLPDALNAAELALLTQQFAGLTPENCMKPEPIHPEPDRYDFSQPDALVAFAERQQMRVVGHTLCWHQQSPAWFLDPGASSDSISLRLEKHIHEVVGRFQGRLYAWDVVNEAVADRGEYLRETPWLSALGEHYLTLAFSAARKADPAARLYYNDYNLERPDKRERALRLLRNLLDAGVRVDGVGIQGHWLVGQVPYEDIEASIRAYAALGLDVMFTELDLDVIERPDCSADLDVQRAYSLTDDLFRHGCSEAMLERQALDYAQLFQLFSTQTAVTRVTFWGLHDGKSWLNSWPGVRTNHPLLFDRACCPKPAYFSVLEALQKRQP